MSQDLVVREQNLMLNDTLAELGREALAAHDRVRQCAAEAVENMVRAGEALCKARDLCDTHQFNQFIAHHFRGKRRTAQTYMKLTRNWPALVAAAPPETLTSQRKALRILDRLLAAPEPSSQKTTRGKRPERPAPADLAAPAQAGSVVRDTGRPADAADDERRTAVREMYQTALQLLAELTKELLQVTPQHYAVEYALHLIDKSRSQFEQRGRELFGAEAITSVPRRSG